MKFFSLKFKKLEKSLCSYQRTIQETNPRTYGKKLFGKKSR
jgi:hypothetical protein